MIRVPPPIPLHGGQREVPNFLTGDEAFPLERYIMQPYSGRRELGNSPRIFSYRLYRARQIVENLSVFGILHREIRNLTEATRTLPHTGKGN